MRLEVTFPKYASVRERLDYPNPGLRPEEAALREDASNAIFELEKLNRKTFDAATDMLVDVLDASADAFEEYVTYLESIRDKLASGDFSPSGLAVEIDWFLQGKDPPSKVE